MPTDKFNAQEAIEKIIGPDTTPEGTYADALPKFSAAAIADVATRNNVIRDYVDSPEALMRQVARAHDEHEGELSELQHQRLRELNMSAAVLLLSEETDEQTFAVGFNVVLRIASDLAACGSQLAGVLVFGIIKERDPKDVAKVFADTVRSL